MTTETGAAKKAKAHQTYHTANGARVPGVTTITGVMDKSAALVPWANKLGLQGINSRSYVDELATIGKLAHYMIECYITGEKEDLTNYTSAQIDRATNCALKFYEWEKQNGLTRESFIASEKQMVSEVYRFGGTIDILANVNGKMTLIDLKTCKGIYGEQKTQVAGGYGLLCEENDIKLDAVRILRIGRDETEGFDDILIGEPERAIHAKRFLICRELYEINKECK